MLFRAGSLQRKFPGMGIGLYVFEQIINDYNGLLWVEREVGSGATFNFMLPLKTGEDEE
jgi:two-component system phosphate regulon sensor histidine kinase PhoR